eukprot:CAMPEP_0185772458 /NCGR_PEP_ID=MMETSP1174-20130828/69188_1 /TAXON_ID=35687 /ORGANISM="Dictyocha speculum, Strain CCMP1381" /LENGTH=136 /DNA_ID=CAMNT_0028458757 /DNA_START=21 /DNA_END=431 /DNA_ORIENTATION=+
MTNLGGLYAEGGYGIDQDVQRAVDWYRKSAEKNKNDGQETDETADPIAQYKLGECYRKGVGVTKNLKLARAWFTEAANHETEGESGMCALGTMLVKGLGGDQDVEKGCRLWMAAARRGITEAENNLQMLSRTDFEF